MVTLGRSLVLLFFTVLLSMQPADHIIETGAGQWRTRELSDGSIVASGLALAW